MYSVHMTANSKSLPREGVPPIIVVTFWFTLVLSIAGNVAATWGHLQDAIIGGLFPVLLVLAERVLHAAGRAPWWVRALIGAVALACIVWSATHLASLAPADAGWMRWLIPIAVDALMILAGLLAVTWASQHTPLPERLDKVLDALWANPPEEAPAPTLPAPSPIVVVQEAPREAPSPALPTTTVEETVTETKTTTRRVSSSGNLPELASRLREGIEKGDVPAGNITAAKTYLSVGHSKAKDVVALLNEEAGA